MNGMEDGQFCAEAQIKNLTHWIKKEQQYLNQALIFISQSYCFIYEILKQSSFQFSEFTANSRYFFNFQISSSFIASFISTRSGPVYIAIANNKIKITLSSQQTSYHFSLYKLLVTTIYHLPSTVNCQLSRLSTIITIIRSFKLLEISKKIEEEEER